MSMAMIYTDYFKKHGISCDMIFVDKYNEYTENVPENYIPLHTKSRQEYSTLKKVAIFWGLRKTVRRILREKQYDLVVVWNEVTAFLFGNLLIKEGYGGRYIINIRDYQHLDAPVVKGRLKKAIDKSRFTTVSSSEYIKYLPEHDYLFIHSLNRAVVGKLERKDKKTGGPIVIMYIGQIGWLENTFSFVDALADDPDFILRFVGVGAEKVAEYAKEKGYKNVQTHGKFKPDETADFLAEADIIYNLYGYGNKHLDDALSIKLYYAIYLGIPILAYDDTFTNKVAKECGIAYTVHGTENMKSELKELAGWYRDLDIAKAREKCDSFIRSQIEKSHADFERSLDEFRMQYDK